MIGGKVKFFKSNSQGIEEEALIPSQIGRKSLLFAN
jgi:hypothetical protein